MPPVQSTVRVWLALAALLPACATTKQPARAPSLPSESSREWQYIGCQSTPTTCRQACGGPGEVKSLQDPTRCPPASVDGGQACFCAISAG